jgi:rubredoxin
MTYQHSVVYKEKKKPISEGEGTYFECSLCGYEWSHDQCIKYCPNCGLQIDIFKKIDVRTPVTWQEAIQAWFDGKTVICEISGTPFEYDKAKSSLIDQDNKAVCRSELIEGTWYIED